MNTQVPTRKINGHEFPYYKVMMDNGTPCDLLSNKPRMTNVLYMCAPRSSNEVCGQDMMTATFIYNKALYFSV